MVYQCSVHGELPDEERVQFTMDGMDEKFCLRCWRDWMRLNIPPLIAVFPPTKLGSDE